MVPESRKTIWHQDFQLMCIFFILCSKIKASVPLTPKITDSLQLFHTNKSIIFGLNDPLTLPEWYDTLSPSNHRKWLLSIKLYSSLKFRLLKVLRSDYFLWLFVHILAPILLNIHKEWICCSCCISWCISHSSQDS